MSSELLLMVCSANVCRSPLAELLLRRHLADLPFLRIESAGVRVQGESVICALVGDLYGDDAWRSAALAHRSRLASRDLLRGAALVLAMDRSVRSEVVRTEPAVRDRVFLLRDAANLVEGFSPDEPTRGIGVVSRFAMHLDRNRALRAIGPLVRGMFRKRREVDRSSIEDGLGLSPRRLAGALDDVTGAAEILASALTGRAS
jgi:protein-tyrosine phosphatase